MSKVNLMSPESSTVDFWVDVWPKLEDVGWKKEKGTRPTDIYMLPPGVERKGSKLRVDYFDSVKKVIDIVRSKQEYKENKVLQDCVSKFNSSRSKRSLSPSKRTSTSPQPKQPKRTKSVEKKTPPAKKPIENKSTLAKSSVGNAEITVVPPERKSVRANSSEEKKSRPTVPSERKSPRSKSVERKSTRAKPLKKTTPIARPLEKKTPRTKSTDKKKTRRKPKTLATYVASDEHGDAAAAAASIQNCEKEIKFHSELWPQLVGHGWSMRDNIYVSPNTRGIQSQNGLCRQEFNNIDDVLFSVALEGVSSKNKVTKQSCFFSIVWPVLEKNGWIYHNNSGVDMFETPGVNESLSYGMSVFEDELKYERVMDHLIKIGLKWLQLKEIDEAVKKYVESTFNMCTLPSPEYIAPVPLTNCATQYTVPVPPTYAAPEFAAPVTAVVPALDSAVSCESKLDAGLELAAFATPASDIQSILI